MVIETSLTTVLLLQLDQDECKFNHVPAIIACTSVSVVYLGLLWLLFMAYLYRLKYHTEAMVAFHIFLASYRHTPKSKNITKYLPPQDAIYEEASQFERSNWDANSSIKDFSSNTIKISQN